MEKGTHRSRHPPPIALMLAAVFALLAVPLVGNALQPATSEVNAETIMLTAAADINTIDDVLTATTTLEPATLAMLARSQDATTIEAIYDQPATQADALTLSSVTTSTSLRADSNLAGRNLMRSDEVADGATGTRPAATLT